jgi:hypothetical protein
LVPDVADWPHYDTGAVNVEWWCVGGGLAKEGPVGSVDSAQEWYDFLKWVIS